MDARTLKVEAARTALAHVGQGMRLGIGTGSTAEEFVRLLAERVAQGLEIVGVPTSERTAALCRELGVPLATLDEMPELDLTVDGADEVDGALTLVKGGGGALLREKIVAAASARMIVIADESKLVGTLGRFPLPIEVNRFGLRATEQAIAVTAGTLGLAWPGRYSRSRRRRPARPPRRRFPNPISRRRGRRSPPYGRRIPMIRSCRRRRRR
jgi:ribose 5-phosphate isomerase A